MGTIVDTSKVRISNLYSNVKKYSKMGFGDLKSDSGISTLNDYLKDKSYIEGYQPSAADTVVFASISASPKAEFVHALRWFRHILSYGKDVSGFPGVPRAISEYGPVSDAPSKTVIQEDDDDDANFDPFASDDEDEAKKKAQTPAKTVKVENDGDDDDDFDPFASDDEDAEEKEKQEKIKQERLDAYAAAKANKKVVIAKSSILLDVKPWDDETDMQELEKCVRSVQTDGLVWGASIFVPLAYGIKKLQILCTVEDDKVGTDFLEEEITAFDDFVQSVDVATFNKI